MYAFREIAWSSDYRHQQRPTIVARLGVGITSSTITPAPSPITKPLRLASKGREASSGQWLKLVVRDRDRSNPVKARGWIQDSAEPATMTSASPKAINRDASPIECAPVVQAVVAACEGPLKPYFIEMCPAARFMSSLGTKYGDTFFGPEMHVKRGRSEEEQWTHTFSRERKRRLVHFFEATYA